MFYKCCVCKISRQDVILHHFLCTKKRLHRWLKCLGRDDLKNLTSEQFSNHFVCQKHFEKKFVTSTSRLLRKAYPSLFTEEEILSGIPSQDNAENMDSQAEHSYVNNTSTTHILRSSGTTERNNSYWLQKCGQMNKADIYCHKLQTMKEELAAEQPRLVNRSRPLLLHDNARPHTAQQTTTKLDELQLERLRHVPYTPDFAPTDFSGIWTTSYKEKNLTKMRQSKPPFKQRVY